MASGVEIVMVVHGAEVFDQGDVSRFQLILSPQKTLVAGVMARTAAEESGLRVEFCGEPPSALIRRLDNEVILLNRGKTPESGRIFGEMVSARVGRERGFFHLECSSRTLYLRNHPDRDLGQHIANATGFEMINGEHTSQTEPGRRKIRGCLPGEAVCINGLVIGRATAKTVVIERKGNGIHVVSGLIPKPHGLEKLHRVARFEDLSSLWCKSGGIRSGSPRVSTIDPLAGKVIVIDHCGHDIYRLLDTPVCGILAIGDDTTNICGHIASHRGIPVLGVVDGDADILLVSGFTPGSAVIQVDAGTDDFVGRELAGRVPKRHVLWEEWVQEILEYLSDRGYEVRHF